MECPKCRFKNAVEMLFCGKCGESLNQGMAAKPVKSIAESERKQVTALFSDITGYAAITGLIDPEEVKEVTDRIFQGVAEIVARYDGFIEHFAGDAILALFGVPKSHGDDPIRALHAACEIHDFVESLNFCYEVEIGDRFSMHSGVNTGIAISADVNFASGTHGVTGDVINVAARLSDLARAHEILVGFDTYRACRNYFSFDPLTSVIIKGKTKPIPICKLVSTKVSKLFNVTPEHQFSSVMVGRNLDLRKLEMQVEKTIHGKGMVVNMIGEAGIGKSRLIAELKKCEVMRSVTLLECQAISTGKYLSFHPIIDLIKRWAMISEDDTNLAAVDKIEKTVRAVHPEKCDEIIPFMATLMGLTLVGRHAELVKDVKGEGLEKLILKSLQELLIRGSEQQPVIVITEDLHWADASSIKLLRSLYRLVEKYRITFFNVFRSGYLDSDTGTVANIKELLSDHYAETWLRSLNNSDSEMLLDNMLELKNFPRSIKTRIVEHAGGNPFFIEEVVYSLIDEAAVAWRDSGFHITDKIDSIVIPPTINDVLIARLDRLEVETRELVKIASVIGRTFFGRVIREVADDIDDIDNRLEHLKDAQFINERIRMQELEYRFRHALVQEAVYNSILIKQRKELHLQVAKSIEKLFEGRLHEFYGMLSFHYSKGEELEKAEEYLIKAGEESLRSSASIEALVYFQKALKLFLDKYGDSADPEKLIFLEKNIALAFCLKGQLVESLIYYDRVLERFGVRPSGSKIIESVKFAVNLLWIVSKLYFPSNKIKRNPNCREKEIFETTMKRNETLVIADTGRAFSSMISLLRMSDAFDITKTANGFRLWVGSGTVFSYMGVSFRIAEKFLKRSEEMVNKDKIEDVIAHNNSDAMHKHCAGFLNEMADYDENLVDSCLRAGVMFYIVPYSWSVGSAKIEQGHFADAEIIIDKLFDIAETYDHNQAKLVALGLKSHLLSKLRDFSEAEKVADLRFSLAGETGVIIVQLAALGCRIVINAMRDDVDVAMALIARAEELISGSDRLPPYCIAGYLVGRFNTDISALKKIMNSGSSVKVSELKKRARRSGREALRNVRRYVPSGVITFKTMGDYFWLVDEQKNALQWWDKAVSEGKRMGARPDLSLTYFTIGRRMMEPHSRCKQLNGICADGYLEKAEILFAEMGLERDLEELQQFRNTLR